MQNPSDIPVELTEGCVRCRTDVGSSSNLTDITEVWRRGTVIGSWLLDVTAGALLEDPQLEAFGGRVSDSGEGRWTLQAAIDEAVPAHVLCAALYERFAPRGEADFANQVLSAMRHQFGGYAEQARNVAK